MTKTMEDVKTYVTGLQRNGQVMDIASTLASDLRRRMAECLTERELIGIDYLNAFVYEPFVCGSHDYLDANMVVFDAVADYCERVVGIARAVFIDTALSAEEMQNTDGAVLTLFQTGWDQVKKEGFSQFWNSINDEDIRRDVGLLVLATPQSATHSHALNALVAEEFDAVYERIVGDRDDLRQLRCALGHDADAANVLAFVEATKSNQSATPTL